MNYNTKDLKLDSITINGEPIVFKNNKELKGYMYDSLVYRYIRAREQMAEYEYLRDRQSHISNHIEWTEYRQRANRDISRFVQILNEAIGEHE